VSGGLAPPEPGAHSIPIETDAPDAQRYRRILQQDMAPAGVKALEPAIHRRVTELIDDVIESGRCDLVDVFTVPLPARTMMAWIGFDERDWRDYVSWVHGVIHHGLDHENLATVLGNIASATTDAIEDRRRYGLRDDLLSKLLAADLSDEEIHNYAFTLVVAGLDTTSAGLANSLVLLDRRRDLRQRLIPEPELMTGAIEEFLRYESPVVQMARTAATDIELGGEQIKAGDRLILVWPAANRDPAEFTDPEEVVIDRQPNRHMAFGVGLHRCMGSNIARSLMRIGLSEVLRRIPDYRIVDPDDLPRFADLAFVNPPTSMPVEFTPGRRELEITAASSG
jgi:cytochrome P450